MLVGRVIYNQVHDELHPSSMQCRDELVNVLYRAVGSMYGSVVGNVIPHVDLG
jgi:hypothetical protein